MRVRSEIANDFAHAIGDAEIVVLHASSRAIGPVAGGIESIFFALLDALGASRTVVVPTFTASRIDPSSWRNAPPRRRWNAIRDELPFFDPLRSPPERMGKLAELVSRLPGAVRSPHPVESVAAFGSHAHEIALPHSLLDPKGPESPWARMVEADARILLVGVGLERCSMIHHAEHRAHVPYEARAAYATPIEIDGARHWIEVEESGGNCSDGFPKLAPLLRARSAYETWTIGDADTIALPARSLVETACELLAKDPAALLCDRADCPQCAEARR